MKLDAKVIPIANDGTPEIGSGQVQADGWRGLFHSTKRSNKKSPRVREWADFFGHLALWNPFGLENPMIFDQCTKTRIASLKNPLDDMLRIRADVHEFMEAGREFPHPLLSYIGELRTLAMKPGETENQYYNRALLELRPYLHISTQIGLDATTGFQEETTDFSMVLNRVEPKLIKALRNQIELFIEPSAYTDSSYLHRVNKIILEEFLTTRESRHDGSESWRDGRFKNRPMMIPGIRGENVYVRLTLDPKLSAEVRVDQINAYQQRWPEFTMMVNVGQLPYQLLG